MVAVEPLQSKAETLVNEQLQAMVRPETTGKITVTLPWANTLW